jgi:hypothetical protein
MTIDHRQGGIGGDDPGEGGGAAGGGDDHLHPPLLGSAGKLPHLIRGPVGREDVHLIGDAHLLQHLQGLLEDRLIGLAPHH